MNCYNTFINYVHIQIYFVEKFETIDLVSLLKTVQVI